MSQLTSSQLVVRAATTIEISLQLLYGGKKSEAVGILEGTLNELNEYLGRNQRG